MKTIFLVLGLSAILSLTGGCLKDDSCKDKTVQSEQAAMSAFATTNGITTTAHSSGLLYQIINQGNGQPLTVNSQVSVKYTGKLANGTIFEQVTTATNFFSLTGVIAGWQIGLPLIQKGGTIRLIIPSSMAWGCKGSGAKIPANSIVYFEIELVDVK